MSSIRTCRFCKVLGLADGNDLVRYGPRHYACPACLLDHKGPEAIAALFDWQILSIPYRVIVAAGLEDRAREAYDRIRGRAPGR